MIQTCFVVSGSKAFYSTFVVVFKAVLQSNVDNKVQFLVVNRSSVIDQVDWFGDCKDRVIVD